MKKELEQYRDLVREIDILKDKIEKLKTESRIEHDTVTGSNANFPYQPISISIDGFIDNSNEIKKQEKILKARLIRCERLKIKIEEFIDTIPDSQTRIIFQLRYIDNLSWLQVSKGIGIRYADYSRVKHNRYLEEVGES